MLYGKKCECELVDPFAELWLDASLDRDSNLLRQSSFLVYFGLGGKTPLVALTESH